MRYPVHSVETTGSTVVKAKALGASPDALLSGNIKVQKCEPGRNDVTGEIQRRAENQLASIEEMATEDNKLSAAFRLASSLAKKDRSWRTKANRVARNFVHNRRELGMALNSVIPHKGGRPTRNTRTVREFGITNDTSERAQILASIPEEALEALLDEMEEKDVIQIAPLYRLSKSIKGKKDIVKVQTPLEVAKKAIEKLPDDAFNEFLLWLKTEKQKRK